MVGTALNGMMHFNLAGQGTQSNYFVYCYMGHTCYTHDMSLVTMPRVLIVMISRNHIKVTNVEDMIYHV